MKFFFIIVILVVTFMQGIYNYVPETNHVSMVYSDAAVLYLQFVLHGMLFLPRNMLLLLLLLSSSSSSPSIIIIITITDTAIVTITDTALVTITDSYCYYY